MSMLQLLGGVAVAGVVAAGSTALTGSGLTMTPTTNKFVGGSIDQNITGANVDTIVYHYADAPTNTEVDYITIGLTGTAGKAFSMSATGTGFGASGATRWTCNDGTSTPGNGAVAVLTGTPGVASTNSVVCTTTDNTPSAAGYFAGMTKLTIGVA